MNRTMRISLLFVSAGALLAGIAAFREYKDDTLRKGYILRGEYGTEAFEEDAVARTQGSVHTVPITVDPRALSAEEAGRLLEAAAEELEQGVFGELPLTKIDRNLSLPDTVCSGSVQVAWTTEEPDLLRFDGTIGSRVPVQGAPVRLTAELTLGTWKKVLTYDLTVFPESVPEDEQFSAAALEEIKNREDKTQERLLLPDTVGGAAVTWSKKRSFLPLYLLLLGVFAAFLYPLAEKSRRAAAQKKREEEMLFDYPKIAVKLILLLHAGLSARSAIRKIALDYTKAKDRGVIRPGFEEVLTMYYEMNRGVTELAAYRNFGRRCRCREYRTLSALLAENLTKGSRTLLTVLDKEAGNAEDERRKRARIRGEKANLLLLFPMLLQLGIVLVIMMVPAFMTMF